MFDGEAPWRDRPGEEPRGDVAEQLRQVRARRQVERRVSDLGVPVQVWQRLLHDAARRAGMEVITSVVPAGATGGSASEQLLIVQLADSADGGTRARNDR